MRATSLPSVQRQGFTLVELLVVIGIIALLISILLPSLNRARKSAQAVACASNMRQVGLAILQYVNDHDQQLPFAATLRPGSPQINISWDDLLAPYFGLTLSQSEFGGGFNADLAGRWSTVLSCPSDPEAPRTKRTYRMVVHNNNVSTGKFTWNSGSLEGGVANVSGPANPWPEQLKITKVRASTATILMTEFSAASHKGVGTHENCYIRYARDQVGSAMTMGLHGGSVNYLFVDGHVDRLRPVETVLDQNPLYATPGTSLASHGFWSVDPEK